MTQDLAKEATEKGIAYFLISFVDLFGTMRAKLVPAAAIGAMQRDGAAFAGFATHLDLTPADPDIFAVPDPDTLTVLPWQPDIGWVMADIVFHGAPLEQAPRQVLKRQIAAAASQGYRLKTGVEAEFFVVNPDGSAIADTDDRQAKPCYDPARHRRPARVLQVHGQATGRAARAARDLHAEAVRPPDRQRLPRSRFAVGRRGPHQSIS
jgi:glutamine synthetase